MIAQHPQQDIIERYPLLLRRWQAIELCRMLGGSERTFRRLVAEKAIHRHQLFGGVQYRYVRDEIAANLSLSS